MAAKLCGLRNGPISEQHGLLESAGQPIDRMGMALADQLGTERLLFPGDHMGFGPRADTFAATLHRAFAA
jgi:hypothetical protein